MQALDLYQDTGHRLGLADALNAVGWYHALLGDHQQALTCCRRALPLLQEINHRDGQAATWDSLGDTHHTAGNPHAAAVAWRHALAVLHDLNHPDADNVRAKLHGLDRTADINTGAQAGSDI